MNRLAHLPALHLAIVSILSCYAAHGAELRMNWAGHDADGIREIELEVGEQAVIEYRISLEVADTLSGLFFTNESQPLVEQVVTMAAPAGWDDGSVDGLFSDIAQQYAVAATGMNDLIAGPGEVLLGSQTIELVGGGAGDQVEIAFALAQLGVLNESGGFYALTASGTQFADIVGFVHLGVGSPGYTRNMVMDVREPLIITVADSGGGGGSVGNGNDNGTGNDNANMNDNGAGNVNDNGSANDNTNDNQNTNDNGAGNGNDNSAANGNTNANDNGANGNTNANDNSAGNVNGNSNSGNGNDNGDGTDKPRGLCGLGLVSMLPLNLLGLWALRRRQRRAI